MTAMTPDDTGQEARPGRTYLDVIDDMIGRIALTEGVPVADARRVAYRLLYGEMSLTTSHYEDGSITYIYTWSWPE